MAMLRICAADGCDTKTLGRHCIQHEPVQQPAARGHVRPHVAVTSIAVESTAFETTAFDSIATLR